MRIFHFLPAIVTALTGGAIAVFVMPLLAPHQPPGEEYPDRLMIYQFAMFAFALLLAFPVRWIWLPAFLLLIGGVFLAGFSVGMFYIPTVAVACWVMARRFEETPGADQAS